MSDGAVHFQTLKDVCDHLEIVKKSKFYSYAFPCETAEEFQKVLLNIKSNHPGATHYCYAYRIHEQVLVERYSDDGEPSGTAGIPMLEVLKGRELVQCGTVVVRFYGGTKLGTGGLSRAYSGGVIGALEEGEVVAKDSALIIEVAIDYHLSGKIEYYINHSKKALVDTVYDNKVKYVLAVKKEEYDKVEAELIELTSGQGTISIVEETIGYFGDGSFTYGNG